MEMNNIIVKSLVNCKNKQKKLQEKCKWAKQKRISPPYIASIQSQYEQSPSL